MTNESQSASHAGETPLAQQVKMIQGYLATIRHCTNEKPCPMCGRAFAKVNELLAALAASPDQWKTRHGGNVATGTPFYLQPGQCEPEYDQGDSVVVWYDDLYDLAARALRAASPDLQEPTDVKTDQTRVEPSVPCVAPTGSTASPPPGAVTDAERTDEPYFVEVEDNGCDKCGNHRMWTIVGPDGAACGQSWGDEEVVSDIAELLNDAYAAGRASASPDVPPPSRTNPSERQHRYEYLFHKGEPCAICLLEPNHHFHSPSGAPDVPQAAPQNKDNMFWPPKDASEEHLYEIRHGRNADYVQAHVKELQELWAAPSAPQASSSPDVAHPIDARTPLHESELDELERRLSGARPDVHPAHTRAWALVAIRQLRASPAGSHTK